jgi:hypothetical protein
MLNKPGGLAGRLIMVLRKERLVANPKLEHFRSLKKSGFLGEPAGELLRVRWSRRGKIPTLVKFMGRLFWGIGSRETAVTRCLSRH